MPSSMPIHRTFGTWLAAWPENDPIGDLRDDFNSDCRRKQILASSIKTGAEMERLMYRSSWEWGCVSCQEALSALEEACILYGDPWRKESDEDEEEDDEDEEEDYE